MTCAAAAAEIEAAQQRGAHVSAETCTQYLVNTIDDLRRDGVEGARYICSPPLRDASNHEPLWDYVRRGVLESVSTDHCPFNYEQKSRGLDNFSLVPNGLPVIQHRLAKLWDEGVVTGRITPSQLVDRTSTTIARRFGLHDKGAIAPGKDADICVFDPSAPRALRRRQLAHERRLRPLRGRDGERQRAPHVLPRRARLRPRRDPHAARPRPLRPPERGARGGGRMSLVIDADRVLADLKELHERHGGPDGARRLAWSEDWLAAREWFRGKLDELDGITVDRDEAGNVWAELPGDGDGFLIVGSHLDAVPSGGWLDGCLGVMAALGVLRALARPASARR